MITTLLRPRNGPRLVQPPRYGSSDRGYSAVLAGLPNTAGLRVDEDSAMSLSVVYACVRVISGALMSLPFEVRGMDADGGSFADPESPARRVLHQRANPYMSAGAFRETLQAWALTYGNGYAEIQLDASLNVTALWPISPDRVSVAWLDKGEMVYMVDGQTPVPPHRMFHLHGLGFDGVSGYSVIKMAARTMGIAIASERYQSQFYANNAQPGVVIGFETPLKPNEAEDMRKRMEDRYGQANSGAFRPLVLHGGPKVSQLGVPNAEAQFLETRQFGVVEGCRWFGVPPFAVGHLEGAAYNNVEQQMLQFAETRAPWAHRWEQEADYKLLGEADNADGRGERYTKINMNALMRPDAKARGEFYKLMTGMGAMNINEVRGKEDMNPIDGGDVHLIPVNNMAPLDTVRDMAQADLDAKKKSNAAPPPSPPPPPGAPAPGTQPPEPPPPPGPPRRQIAGQAETPAQTAERHTLALHEIAVDAFSGLEKVCENIRARSKSPAEARDAILARAEKHREAVRPVAFSAVRAACIALGGAGVEAIDRLTAQAVEFHADRFTFALAAAPESPIAAGRASDLLSWVASVAAAEIVKETAA